MNNRKLLYTLAVAIALGLIYAYYYRKAATPVETKPTFEIKHTTIPDMSEIDKNSRNLDK